MTKYVAWVVAVLFIVHSAGGHAQSVMAPVAAPVDHPLVANHPVRTAGAWRQGLGRFGESLASGFLRLRGYEVIDMKLPGNRGIDLVAVKRTATGTLSDVRLIEVKTHYGSGKPQLGQTRVGTQMSRQWLADRLRTLRASGEQGRKLALEISRFRRAQGIPLERLGEIHDVNLRTGKYTIRNPVSMAERAGPMSIERLLKRVYAQSTEPTSQIWAMRHLSQLKQLRQARMGSWLSASSSTRAFDRVTSTQIALLQEKQALRGARRGLVRAAGRVAIVVALAMDAYEIYSHVRDYHLGKISKREFVIALARSGGGIAGAWAGAAGGAWVGAQIGALGGPWAWITVPVGGFVGGAVGGVAGYFFGARVGEFTAQAWYNSLDRNVRERVSGWLKETPNPFGNGSAP
jgi:Holliday junction resolvase-like predicted endonuclease